MQYARKNMNDFVLIKKTDGTRLMPEQTVDLFQESKRYIFDALKTAGDKNTVVVTHHGVSPLSIHEKFRGDSLNCAFMTDLSNEIIDHGPDLPYAQLIRLQDRPDPQARQDTWLKVINALAGRIDCTVIEVLRT